MKRLLGIANGGSVLFPEPVLQHQATKPFSTQGGVWEQNHSRDAKGYILELCSIGSKRQQQTTTSQQWELVSRRH